MHVPVPRDLLLNLDLRSTGTRKFSENPDSKIREFTVVIMPHSIESQLKNLFDVSDYYFAKIVRQGAIKRWLLQEGRRLIMRAGSVELITNLIQFMVENPAVAERYTVTRTGGEMCLHIVRVFHLEATGL